MKRQIYVASSESMEAVQKALNQGLLKLDAKDVIDVTFVAYVDVALKKGIGYVGQIHYLIEETTSGNSKP